MAAVPQNTVVTVAYDADSGSLYVGAGGLWANGSGATNQAFGSAVAAYSGITGEISPALSFDTGTGIINFGQRPFAYTPPTGYKKLNTFNLPDSTITDSSKYFVTALYTGSGATRSIDNTITAQDGTETGEAFKFGPDFVWLKARTGGSYHHNAYDTVRGATKALEVDDTDAEATISDALTSFNSNGFSLGADASDREANESGRPMVAWNWKASDSSSATYTVKVVSDSGNKYRFDDFGTSAVTLNLHETGTYTFDQSDSSNSGHPLRFSATSDGTHGGGSEYTTGVTVTGTPGTSGAKTVIVVAASAPTLYYYCSVHSGMGGQANTNVTEGSSNFAGSIISTVSANPSTGFSIATWTGNNTVSTVGHGLGVAPKLVIVKNRDYAANWNVWATGFSGNEYLLLNSIAVKASFTNNWGSTPTTDVFGVGNNNGTNGNTNGMVAYSFAEVEGYSKTGSYTGNSSTNGPFIYTGFRPAFVMTKGIDQNKNWDLYDSARSPFNELDRTLSADSSAAEYVAAVYNAMDFCSNGFKLRNNNSTNNNNGSQFLYMAFAENPFKNSNAR